MKNQLIILLFTSVLLIFSLEFNSVVAGNSAASPSRNNHSFTKMFEEVWTTYDENYPYFIHKNISWDSLRAVFLPEFETCQSDSSFIRLLIDLLGHLRDFHVGLRLADGSTIGSKFDYPRPIRYNMDWECLINKMPNIKKMEPLFYGITIENIGYITIPSWSIQTVEPFNLILEKLRHTRGLIIDVRMNAGGSELAAQQVASRFASHTANYAYHQFRNGSKHNNFSEIDARTISPSSDWRYLKPVVILTGVITMSSCESFVMMMKQFEHITTVGESTRGCSGNPIEVELPNGVKYTVPQWIAYRADKKILEGRGINPDYQVVFTDSHRLAGEEPLIDKAIWIINSSVEIQQLSGNMYPDEFELAQNYPNPFNSSTIIKYSLKERTRVTLNISNVMGQVVFIAVDEVQDPGTYSVTWYGQDMYGRSVTSGVYFYRILMNEFTDVKKMILLH